MSKIRFSTTKFITRLLLFFLSAILWVGCPDRPPMQLPCYVSLEGMPLPNAHVKYGIDQPLNQSTQTDDRGMFIIENIPAGIDSEQSYLVEIISNGSRYIEKIDMSTLGNYGFLNNASEKGGLIDYLYRIYFGEKANYLYVTMFPEFVNYKIIDRDLGIEIVSDYVEGPHRLIEGKKYLIKYSLDQKFNFEKITNFRPSVNDSIDLNIYRLNIITEQPCLAWSILDSNNDLVKEGLGSEVISLNQSGKLKIQVYGTNQLETIYIDNSQDIHDKNLAGECNMGPHRLSINVYNPNASWKLINKREKTILYEESGDQVITNIPTGRYILIEDIGPEYNPRRLEVNMFENKNIEFDLRRYNLSIIARPADSNWKLNHQGQVVKTGRGTTSIEKLSPGDYEIGCFSGTDKYSFNINDRDLSYNLNCGTACISPKIKIILDNCTGSWKLLKLNEDLFQWVNYKNGDESSELNIKYGQYKIQYTKDEHDSYSKIYIFSVRHAECEEVFVQDCSGCNYQIEEAINIEDNSRIISVNEACIEEFDKNRSCNQYFPVTKAYSSEKEYETALKILDDGLLRAIIENECIAFLSDDKYFWEYLFLAENLGIDGEGGEYLLKKSNPNDNQSNNIIEVILSNIIEDTQTKLYAYKLILRLNEKDIRERIRISAEGRYSTDDVGNCVFVEELKGYHHEANRIERQSGIDRYTKDFSNFRRLLDRAIREFECD